MSKATLSVNKVGPFKALIENSSDVFCIVNVTGQVLYVSLASIQVLGYAPEELVGRNTFDLIHKKDRSQSRRALRQVLATQRSQCQIDVRVERKDGGWHWVESTVSNLLDEPQIAGIVITCREIGAIRAARDKERRRIEELVRSKTRLEDFSYAVAHDLREPLRTISMLTALLAKETELSPRGKMMTQYVVDGTARMSAVLEGLHDFAIRGMDSIAGSLELGPVAVAAVQNLAHAITESNAIVTVDPMPFVWGNEEQLLRVFQNLISNAIKYHSAAPVQIHITAERLGLHWMITVKDNGIGIAVEHRERVFRLLQRLHGPEIPGAGIGLAICKKIIEEAGGTI